MDMGTMIRELRLQKGLTLEEVGDMVGVGKSTVRKWESGEIANMRRDKIAKLARALDTTPAYLMGWEEPEPAFDPLSVPGIEPLPKMRRVPIIGAIACGTPILAEENIESYARMSEQIDADFGLRCVGDSMIGARIMNGDIVYIKTDAEVIDGKIYAVLVNGDEATLKRVYRIGEERLELRPENPSYPVQHYAGSELEGVRIIGRAVAFTSAVR